MGKQSKDTAKAAVQQARKSAALAAKDAQLQSKLAKQIYRKKVQEMRPYLKKLKSFDLRKGLTPAQKGYVTRAWQEYQELTLRPTKIYRTKNKKNLKLAQTLSHRDTKVKFDVAFIPTINQQASVKIKNGKLYVKSKYIDECEIPFNMKNLVNDPEAEIARVLAENPEFQQFVLMAGKYIWNGGIARGKILERVTKQLMRYLPGGAGYEKRGPNSHISNWAFGLIGFKAKKQEATENYLRDYHRAKEQKKKEAKNKRRANARKYGKKF